MSTVDPGAAERHPETPSVVIDARSDDVTIIRLFGEHDARTADGIKTEITRAARNGTGVALSLADATFIDSAVVNALVVGDRRLIQYGRRRLVLYVEPGSLAGRALEPCRRNDLLCFSDTFEEATVVAKQPAGRTTAV
jgi:anti-anti-sigma factor